MTDKIFKSERISKTEVIILNAEIGKVFPLFGAIEEKKWADGWALVVLYPMSEIIEEGMVFKTKARGDYEKEYNWIISKYQPKNHLVEYIVSTINQYWVINIHCSSISDMKTKATITYIYTGLNSIGNEINKHAIGKMYRHDLKDWEEAINYFLKTGATLKLHRK